jgi:tetratricopeptide (TPR) repeat protein
MEHSQSPTNEEVGTGSTESSSSSEPKVSDDQTQASGGEKKTNSGEQKARSGEPATSSGEPATSSSGRQGALVQVLAISEPQSSQKIDSLHASAQSSDIQRQFHTTLAHQSFVAISSAFALFEVLFLVLFSDKDWFAVDLLPWGIPAALVALALAHFILVWLESARGCRFFAPILNGLPPVVYRKWILANEQGFQNSLRFGNKRAVWKAIDSAELTFLGNLLLRSRFVTGSEMLMQKGSRQVDQNPAFLLFKVPFGVAAKSDQQEFVRLLHSENPHCQLNSRLQKQIAKDDPKGSSVVLLIVSAFFLLFFMDVGYATFNYLEILKHYYLAELNCCQEPRDIKSAAQHFDRADLLFNHPAQFSWVTRKLIETKNTKAGIMELRADALWRMDRREQAIESLQQAGELSGKKFRIDLKLARMLTDMGKEKQALLVLGEAVEKNRDALVPRAYTIALLETKKNSNPKAARRYLDIAMQEFDDRVFGDEPNWPPSVSPFLADVWHREDVLFVFDRMLKAKR